MNIGFDIIFLSLVAASTGAGFLIGDERSQRMAVGVVIGTLAALEFAEPITELTASKLDFISPAIVSICLLVLSVAACLIGKNVRDPKWPKNKIKALVSGFVSSLVAAGVIISSLEPPVREKLVTDYNLAALAYDLRLITLAALIISIIVGYLAIGKAKK
jgi:hypothetical protein